jgi:hypothetical protein
VLTDIAPIEAPRAQTMAVVEFLAVQNPGEALSAF